MQAKTYQRTQVNVLRLAVGLIGLALAVLALLPAALALTGHIRDFVLVTVLLIPAGVVVGLLGLVILANSGQTVTVKNGHIIARDVLGRVRLSVPAASVLSWRAVEMGDTTPGAAHAVAGRFGVELVIAGDRVVAIGSPEPAGLCCAIAEARDNVGSP